MATLMATNTLPATAAICERNTSTSNCASFCCTTGPLSVSSTAAAKREAVIAGCLVATVKPSMKISMKPRP